MAQNGKTRFLILSDTHSFDFSHPNNADVSLQHPLPKCDVLLHAGDLTNFGGISELEGVIDMLGSIEAELKLVIAGNHDLTLDGAYWAKFCQRTWSLPSASDEYGSGYYDLQDHEKAVAIMTGHRARESGIFYLTEGLHTFTLLNGTTFTIYVSPYQPEFCNMAFPYARDEDRFNSPGHTASGVRKIGGVQVPDFPAVDIMMTHGPPHGVLDEVRRGRTTAHVGCEALLTAASRARPQLYCFGHIHEGYGAELISWKEDTRLTGVDAIEMRESCASTYPAPTILSTEPGTQSLMVNAAINTLRYKPTNAPWLFDLDFDKGNESNT